MFKIKYFTRPIDKKEKEKGKKISGSKGAQMSIGLEGNSGAGLRCGMRIVSGNYNVD